MELPHVILRVADMDRSVRFYKDQVGLEVRSMSPTFSFLAAGSAHIALNHVDDVPEDTSLTEVVLSSPDVVDVHREMEGRGVPFEVDLRPVMTDGDRTLVAAHFRDPDGHLVSVTGWVER